MSHIKQNKSTEYGVLFELVFSQGFEVPCCLDYQFENHDKIFTDYAVVKKEGSGIFVNIRGMVYIGESARDLSDPLELKSLKKEFIKQCEELNLHWFDTFTVNKD